MNKVPQLKAFPEVPRARIGSGAWLRGQLAKLTFMPIVERELRELSRKRMTYRSRAITGFLAVLISLGSIAVGISSGFTTQQLGRNLFVAVSLAAFSLALPAGLILMADCLSVEKRQGTLGLLFLTDLRGQDIVAGKFVGLAMPAVHCLLAIFPVLGMSFLMSGVTGEEFVRATIALSATLFFSLATAMLVSAISREGLIAVGGTVLLMLIPLVFLPLAGHWMAHARLAGGSVFGLLSPWQGLQLSREAEYGAQPDFYWWTIVLTFAWSCVCLILAGVCLPLAWQDRPARSRLWSFRPVWRTEIAQTEADIAERRKMLDRNPMLWLGRRNRWQHRGIWFFLAVAAALAGLGMHGLKLKLSGAIAIFVGVHCLQAGLKVWMAWEASRRFAEDRDNGALELLLCTPMPEHSIWRGWGAHLKRQFLAPVILLVIVDAVVLKAGMHSSSWWGGDSRWGLTFLAGMGLFVSDMYTLSWVGLWNGLTARNATRACLKSIMQILVLPAAGCLGVMGFYTVVIGARIPLGAMTALWFASGYLVDAAVASKCMTQLARDFRAASIYGLAPDQHRKGWNGPEGPDAPVELATQAG